MKSLDPSKADGAETGSEPEIGQQGSLSRREPESPDTPAVGRSHTVATGCPTARTTITGLIGLRGIAAVWVLIHNDSYFRDNLQLDAWTSLLSKGYLAVDFFLVLSGFVLSYVHASDFQHMHRSKWGEFLILRLARIYPLYIFLLAIRVGIEFAKLKLGAGVEFLGPAPFSEGNSLLPLLANATMVQAWGFYASHTWVPSFWSVSAEWFCYLLFPFLALAANRFLKSGYACLIVCLACLAFLAGFIQQFGGIELPTNLSLVRCVPEFTIGLILGIRLDGIRAWLRERNLSDANAGLILILLGLTGVVWIHCGLNDLLPLVLACVLIALVASVSLANRLFSHRWLIFLGEISYAIYLSHIIIQSAWRIAESKFISPESTGLVIGAFLVRLVFILVASTLLYSWIEVPARRRIRTWVGKPS